MTEMCMPNYQVVRESMPSIAVHVYLLHILKIHHHIQGARFSMVQELAGIYRPAMHRNKAKLIELVKGECGLSTETIFHLSS